MPIPNYGYTVTKGVKYAKVHKIDKNGNNQSSYLEQLQSFIIHYDDVGSVQYNITSTQERENYYLFGVSPQPITSSINYYPNNQLVIFNPEFLNWDYSDYNVLLGNAEEPQFSYKYMDIDYSSNPLTPVNFSLIISGTADRAQVQDSNYSSDAWSNIRYNGSRVSSPRFNASF